MTKISQLSDIGASLAGGDEFVVRDVSDATTPNKKVTSSGIIDYVIGTGSVTGFTKISAGAGPLSEVACTFSGSTGTITMGTASAGSPVERLRIDSSGRLLVGTSSARTVREVVDGLTYVHQPNLQLETGNNSLGLSLITNRTVDSTGPFITLGKSRGGTVGSVTVVQNGDELGNIYFAGADGTDIECIGAAIFAEVDGTPGANDMPGRLVFSTTADGASSPTERMRIDSSGRLLIGTSSSGTGAIVEANGKVTGTALNTTQETFSTTSTAAENLTYTLAQAKGIIIYVYSASSPSVVQAPGVYSAWRETTGAAVSTLVAHASLASLTVDGSTGTITLTPNTSDFRTWRVSITRVYDGF